MRYRRFGKTNLQLSLFSLGTMRCLGSEETFFQTVQGAIARGINHLETAQGYGESERYLGNYLGNYLGTTLKALNLSRRQIYLTTKIPPTPDADGMERALDQSLHHLGVDYVDCLALHGVNTRQHLAWVQAESGCMKALERAVGDGRVRHVGFSTHGPLEVILEAIATDRFAFVNLHYYYFFQRNAPAVALAHQKDLGLFIISPADKGGQLYTPSPTLQTLCQPFTPLELTYRFLLQDTRITTLSLGAAHPEELDWPLKVADADYPLTEAEWAIFQSLEHHQTTVLQGDRCSQCYACLPCPESISIPEVLRLRNLAVAYDLVTYGKYRYEMFENAGHWFPGRKAKHCTHCGDCLPRCPEHLPIPDLLNDTHQRLSGPQKRRLWA